ncbi:hypothetical protein JYU20_01155 [Bacteroidales bacterium AH-315-I05]|nr:hypothetical protein [Bacteroidales bacterium AH-315-I05]
MMYRLFSLLCYVLPFYVTGSNNVSSYTSKTNLNGFIENKGQFADEKGVLLKNALFKLEQGNTIIYITEWGLTYFFLNRDEKGATISELPDTVRRENLPPTIVHWERIDMELEGALINKKNITLEGESADYINYYYPHCPDGVLGVHTYQRVTIKEVYPGIDWIIYIDKKEKDGVSSPWIKYDFVVHPGADYRHILWKYYGVESLEIHERENSLGIMGEMASIEDAGLMGYVGKEEVGMKFKKIDTRKYGFDIPEGYDNTKPLIIDPALMWSTYYGGTSVCCGATTNDDNGWGIVSDGTNVFVTGNSNTDNLSLQNPGGGAYYDGTFNGGVGAGGDVVIFQFNTSGVRQWATFYGGSSNDDGHDIDVCGSNVFVTGYTASTNFPTFNPGGGAYFDNTRSGSSDLFILKFNTSGVRQWATYYGGSNNEYSPHSISCDGTNVWATGYTNSTPQVCANGLPTTEVPVVISELLLKVTAPAYGLPEPQHQVSHSLTPEEAPITME